MRVILSLLFCLTVPAFGQSALPPCDSNVASTSWTNCQGTWIDANGNKYVGEFRDGKANGQGTGTWANGRKYVGEFRDDKPHGKGTETGVLGTRYVGGFKDGKRHGLGALTHAYPDGDKYVGEFRGNEPNGRGIVTYADGRPPQEGVFKDAKFIKPQRIPDRIAGRSGPSLVLAPNPTGMVSESASPAANSLVVECESGKVGSCITAANLYAFDTALLDRSKSFAFLKKACSLGSDYACSNVASLNSQGLGDCSNLARLPLRLLLGDVITTSCLNDSIQVWKDLCEKGHALSCSNLSHALLVEKGRPSDSYLAAKRACDLDLSVAACLQLIKFYQEGLDDHPTIQNQTRAYQLSKKVCDAQASPSKDCNTLGCSNNQSHACITAGEIMHEGRLDSWNPELAYEFVTKGCAGIPEGVKNAWCSAAGLSKLTRNLKGITPSERVTASSLEVNNDGGRLTTFSADDKKGQLEVEHPLRREQKEASLPVPSVSLLRPTTANELPTVRVDGSAVAGLLSNEPSSASESAERRVALVIGNAAYKSAPLDNPLNDATDIANELKRRGFKVITRNNANLRSLQQAVRDFSDEFKKSDVGLIYYSGHGVETKGQNYLIPVDADIKKEYELSAQAYPASQLTAMMEEVQSSDDKKRVAILILDACRDNPLTRSWRSSGRGLARMDAPAGTFISFSTSPGSVASDGRGRNSPFTKHLLQAIRKPDVPIELMFKQVRVGVMDETKGEQIPWDSSSLTGDFYFRRTPRP